MGIAFLLLVMVILATVCRADELQYRIDYENCLYNLLHADENNADWDTAKVYRAINLGVTFVEGVSKSNEGHDTTTFNVARADTALLYALSTDAASGGVLNVVYYDEELDELRSLIKRPIDEFGKGITAQQQESKRTYMYSEINDTIMVYPRPDVAYVMHIFSYKVSDWLETDSSEVAMPPLLRLLALEMAYGYAQLMTGTDKGFQRYGEIRNNVLTVIYSIPPATPKDIQSLGIVEP